MAQHSSTSHAPGKREAEPRAWCHLGWCHLGWMILLLQPICNGSEPWCWVQGTSRARYLAARTPRARSKCSAQKCAIPYPAVAVPKRRAAAATQKKERKKRTDTMPKRGAANRSELSLDGRRQRGCATRQPAVRHSLRESLTTGKSPRAPNSLIISGAVHVQISQYCLCLSRAAVSISL